MANCFQNITGYEDTCFKTTILPNGAVKGELKIKRFYPPGYTASTIGNINPSQLTTNVIETFITSIPASLDRNVLQCTPLGLTVTTGKTNTIVNYRSADSGELVSDVIIIPAPIPTDPCNSYNPNLNALIKTSEGIGVMTQGLPSYLTDEQISNQATALTYLDCATQSLKVFIPIAPEITADACTPNMLNNKVVRNNAFTGTPNGFGVFTGKATDSPITTYVDCASDQLWADLLVQPDPTFTTGINARSVNAFFADGSGAFVLTGENTAGGTRTFVDCATKQLWTEIIRAPDPVANNCATNPKTNAFRLYSDGWGVKVGSYVDGCIRLQVGCDAAEELQAEFIIKPNDLTKLGEQFLTPQNVLACLDDGAGVMAGYNVKGGLHLFFNHDASTLLGRVVVDPDSKRGLDVSDTGLKFKISAKDPTGMGDNGFVLRDDGISTYGKNSAVGLHVAYSVGTQVRLSGGANQATNEITLNYTNPTSKFLSGFILFRAPAVTMTFVGSDEVIAVGYEGQYTVGSVSANVGEVHVRGSNCLKWGWGSQTEYRQVTIAPGGTLSAKLKATCSFTGTPTSGSVVDIQSYSIDAFLNTIDTVLF